MMIYDPSIHAKVEPFLRYFRFLSGGDFIVMTSGYRPGSLGYHGKTNDGEAIDYSSATAPNFLIRLYHLMRMIKPEGISVALSVHNNHIHVWRDEKAPRYMIEDKNAKGENVIRDIDKTDLSRIRAVYGVSYLLLETLIDAVTYRIYAEFGS